MLRGIKEEGKEEEYLSLFKLLLNLIRAQWCKCDQNFEMTHIQNVYISLTVLNNFYIFVTSI